jgi:hypothetical protein
MYLLIALSTGREHFSMFAQACLINALYLKPLATAACAILLAVSITAGNDDACTNPSPVSSVDEVPH